MKNKNNNPCKQGSDAYKFYQLAQVDENGYSRRVTIDEWEAIGLGTDNGCQWLHKGSTLDNNFYIKREYAVTSRFNKRKNKMTTANRLVAVTFMGKKEKPEYHNIPEYIRQYYKDKPSVMSGIYEKNKMELDHKNGLYDTPVESIDDVQPLTTGENDFKRQKCKECRATNYRFDATTVPGNPIPYYYGGVELSIYGCKGCYLQDIKKYREVTTKNAEPLKVYE